MIARALAMACLVLAFAVPVNAAQAGILKNVAKLAVVSAKGNAEFLKKGLKGGAKLARESAAGNANVVRCIPKAFTKKPCF